MRRSTRLAVVAAAASLLLATTGCAASSGTADDGGTSTITIGFNPGPYFEMFQEGILPILEQDGYTVETKDFTDGVIVNVALNDGEIDANIMQHPVYMDSINVQEGLSNVALAQVPGPPMGLFAGKQSSLDDIETGATVSIPNQPSNQYRALKVLEAADLITVSESMDPSTASLRDVTGNPHKLNFVEMENAQQVAALTDVDYAVIQGNFVVSGGLKLTDAIALEELTDEFSVVVAVEEADVDSDWAQAIKAAYESQSFAEYIADNEIYDGYNLPDALEN